jgi:molybdate transport system substrate-binding protein
MKRGRFRLVLLGLFVLILFDHGFRETLAAAQTLSIAAASDLRFALDDIVAAFEKGKSGHKVRVSYGSSGNFFAQLSQRAPYDMFLSADLMYPAKLIEAGHGVADTKFSYAVGRLVIWAPTNSPTDPSRQGIESLKASSVRRIAVANPEHAPYGRAAVAALRHFGIYEVVKDKLVYGENIAQTAQFVESGSADLGLIALGLALAPAMKEKGRYWEVPLNAFPRLEQGGVILRWSKNRELTTDFRAFMLSDPGQAILRRYGFFMPND